MKIKGIAGTISFTILQLATVAMPAYAEDVPNINRDDAWNNHSLTDKTQLFLSIISYVVISGCIAGCFIVAFKMATSYRNGEFGEAVGRLATVAAACIIVGTATSFVTVMTRG